MTSKRDPWFTTSTSLRDRKRRLNRVLVLGGYGFIAAAAAPALFARSAPKIVTLIYVTVLIGGLAIWLVATLVVIVRHALEGRREVREWQSGHNRATGDDSADPPQHP